VSGDSRAAAVDSRYTGSSCLYYAEYVLFDMLAMMQVALAYKGKLVMVTVVNMFA
jgi:hypothetical protein